jgi:hypothetical protein
MSASSATKDAVASSATARRAGRFLAGKGRLSGGWAGRWEGALIMAALWHSQAEASLKFRLRLASGWSS